MFNYVAGWGGREQTHSLQRWTSNSVTLACASLAFAPVFVLDNTTPKQQLAQKGSGLATEIDNTSPWRAFKVPITTAPTILQINFRSQSHSEPPLDLKIIHNKSSVSSEILQDYSRISSSSLHDFLDDYSSMRFRAVTNPSSPQNSRLLFWTWFGLFLDITLE